MRYSRAPSPDALISPFIGRGGRRPAGSRLGKARKAGKAEGLARRGAARPRGGRVGVLGSWLAAWLEGCCFAEGVAQMKEEGGSNPRERGRESTDRLRRGMMGYGAEIKLDLLLCRRPSAAPRQPDTVALPPPRAQTQTDRRSLAEVLSRLETSLEIPRQLGKNRKFYSNCSRFAILRWVYWYSSTGTHVKYSASYYFS